MGEGLKRALAAAKATRKPRTPKLRTVIIQIELQTDAPLDRLEDKDELAAALDLGYQGHFNFSVQQVTATVAQPAKPVAKSRRPREVELV